MKKVITSLFVFCSLLSLGQQDVFKVRDLIQESSTFKNILNPSKNRQNHKALSFEEAYTTLIYDTANTKWDSTTRTTTLVDPLSNQSHKVALSLIGERFNGQFWIQSDSGYAIMDTSINRFKVPEEYVFDTLKSFAWDSANAAWVLFLENRMTVNANKDILAYETFINLQALGVPIPGMQPFARADFNYNSLNELQYWTTKELAFGTGLQNTDSVVVTVNTNGYRTVDEVYEWDGSNWAKEEKFIYQYNANNELTEEVYQSYDPTLGYINSNRNTYTYNPQGNPLLDSAFIHNNGWILNRIKSESYTPFGERMKEIDYAIDNNNAAYVFSEQDYFYNAQNNRDSVVSKSRYTHNPTAPLIFEEKDIYRYTPFTNGGGGNMGTPLAPSNLIVIAGRKSGLKMTLSWTDNSNNEDGFTIERSLDSLNWVVIDSVAPNMVSFDDTTVLGSTTYYYRIAAFNSNGNSSYSNTSSASSLAVGIEKITAQKLSFYPNPAREVIYFSSPLKVELLLLDMGGKLLQRVASGSLQMNISELKSGLYLINDNGRLHKLIKE